MDKKFDSAALMERVERAAISPEQALPEARDIETITAEILTLKQSAGDAIIGIGQRLIEAKEMLPHGSWLPWLEERVEFSERTARNFMRLAREWTNRQALADLGAAKALTLLALPPEERETFMEANHLVNGEEKTVIDMTSRELEQAVRERDEARLAGVSLDRAARYLQSFGGNPAVSAQLWADYLDAAVKLKYDLSRDDVRMPKDLAARHDHAAAAVQAEEDEKAMKRYRARYRQLTEQFSFSAEGLCVAVPKGVQDIVREGRILKHCVGGYADRHVDGRVTILFLRKASAPDAPYVTIELSTENNCRELDIRQIHGYRNEADGSPPPERVHAGFLKTWLDWVHAGSPRDREGQPVLAAEIPAA